ncbi:MAG: hypothetical protein FJX02_00530 [Alphaproteobacteria bacterium]|nr:hypothetical protein [Alphaproteobacteria bacterium]
MRRRSVLSCAGAIALPGALCACAGAVHQLPSIAGDRVGLAQTEIANAAPPTRRAVAREETEAMLNAVWDKLAYPASLTCREMNVGVCDWRIRVSGDRALNASAGPGGEIVLNLGIFEHAANEAELALVLAHEIGHQAANHIEQARRNTTVGAVIGGLLMGVLMAAATYRSNDGGRATRDAMEVGANTGGRIGRISYSKEQEREADYLAAVMLYRGAFDLDQARGFLLTMARLSGRTETGLLDTHPAGPDRIAAWDAAVAEIRAADGKLPKRA